MRRIDLTGQTFGRLTAVGRAERSGLWRVRCSCGKEKDVRGSNLTGGYTRSCGCLQRERTRDVARRNAKDRTGQRFGRLVVTGRAPNRGRQTYSRVQCDCGTVKDVMTSSLVTGSTVSCGCLGRERIDGLRGTAKIDLTGETFGRLTVTGRAASRKRGVYWRTVCECGNERVFSTGSLRSGAAISCGRHGRFRGARYVKSSGYVEVSLRPDDPYAVMGRVKGNVVLVPEHRYVMAQHLGRPLEAHENVHHVDGSKTNNSLENLELWSRSQPSGQRVGDLHARAQLLGRMLGNVILSSGSNRP